MIHFLLNNSIGRILVYKRISACVSSEVMTLFPAEEIIDYKTMRQTIRNPDLMITQLRYYWMYKYFQEYYPDIFSSFTSVVDVGDSSGILFKAMKRIGLSVNIDRRTVEFILSKGIDAVIGDAEKLQFADKSFDYSFCFQCLEHLPNPIRALRELERITRKKIFISIPYVTKTIIYKNTGGHIFEFLIKDFINILSYIPLRRYDHFFLNYYSPLGSKQTNQGSYFSFFILEPEGRNNV